MSAGSPPPTSAGLLGQLNLPPNLIAFLRQRLSQMPDPAMQQQFLSAALQQVPDVRAAIQQVQNPLNPNVNPLSPPPSISSMPTVDVMNGYDPVGLRGSGGGINPVDPVDLYGGRGSGGGINPIDPIGIPASGGGTKVGADGVPVGIGTEPILPGGLPGRGGGTVVGGDGVPVGIGTQPILPGGLPGRGSQEAPPAGKSGRVNQGMKKRLASGKGLPPGQKKKVGQGRFGMTPGSATTGGFGTANPYRKNRFGA